jgi:hypothetical protein
MGPQADNVNGAIGRQIPASIAISMPGIAGIGASRAG